LFEAAVCDSACDAPREEVTQLHLIGTLDKVRRPAYGYSLLTAYFVFRACRWRARRVMPGRETGYRDSACGAPVPLRGQ
jgi:hypothetical protein